MDEPSSLGVAMPSVSEYAAVAPVAPVLPQLPQVSQGDSSTRLITVALPVGVGVGEGEGPVPGVGDALGDGTLLALVEDEAPPPHEAISKDSARIAEQVLAACQSLISTPLQKLFCVSVGGTVILGRAFWITLKA